MSRKGISKKIIPLPITIYYYYKEIIFDIIRIVIYYIILGVPYLKNYKLEINQIRGRILKSKRTNNITNIL